MKQQLGFTNWLNAIRQWLAILLKTRGSLTTAAEAMHRLNVYARFTEKDEKQWIYKLKNNFVQHLYQSGHCTGVAQKIQRMKCLGTWRHDCCPDCHKCGGTGIFREYILLEFKFRIGDNCYIWHQPRSMVNWPVKLSGQCKRKAIAEIKRLF